MKALLIAVAICATSAFAVPAFSHEDPSEPKRYIAKGEVQKVDMQKGTITLKHEPLENLRMPAATKAFPVKNPEMLKHVKPGDKVLFSARNINGTIMISTLESPQAHKPSHAH